MTSRRAIDLPAKANGASAPETAGDLRELLELCVREGASDLHLSPGHPPFLRIHGQLAPVGGAEPLSGGALRAIAQRLVHPRSFEDIRRSGSLDGAITAPCGTRFRHNVYLRGDEPAIALRRLEDRFRTLGELGLPESLYELADSPDGLVLVSGPTGSGKSTTLAALLDRINSGRRCHVVTIEDPVEYVHASRSALVNQRQVGIDAPSFYEALVASLRQDPDVILVGEVRELETIRTAITAAETGHLVFSTVHANDCVGAVERLVSVFSAGEQDSIRRQLSLVLRAIVAQRLLVADGGPAQRPGGERRSRVAACEILRAVPAVANLIAQGKSGQIYSMMETGSAAGMQTMEQDLARLWVAGDISEAAAAAFSRNPEVMRQRAQRMRGRGASPSRQPRTASP